MAETKVSRKKLTEAGGGVCLLAFTAAFISAMGLAMEFLGALGYNRYADVAQTYVFAKDAQDYIFTYDKSIITFLISITAFFILMAYRRKKKVGAELPAVLIISSAACAIKPVAFLLYALNNSEFVDLFRNSGDSRTFLAVMTVLVYALPLVSCLFLMICGLVLAIKLMGEEFRVEVPSLRFEEIVKDEDITEDLITKTEKKKTEEVIPDFEFKNSNYMPPEAAKEKEEKAVEASVVMVNESKDGKCPHCGEKLKADARFCQSCGGKIEK